MNESITKEEDKFFTSPYQLTSSLIWNDRNLLLWYFLIISIPPMLFNQYYPTSQTFIIATIIARVSELTFIFLVTRRWLQRVSSSPMSIKPATVAYFAIFGFIYWALIEFPRLALSVTIDGDFQIIFLMLYFPAIYLSLKYYFYFIPAVFGEKIFAKILLQAKHYTFQDLRLPLRTMIAPLGLTILLKGAITAFSPDLRHLSASILNEIASNLFLFFSTYLSIGFILAHKLTPKLFENYNLNPYYASCIETINVNKKKWITTQLSVRHGFFLLLVGALLWTANGLQLSSLPPAPKITLIDANAINQHVIVTLDIEDEKFNFRGFHPISFNLAGENRTAIAPPPIKAQIDSSPEDVRLQLPPNRSKAILQLEFLSNRKGKALTELEDLYLWYFNVKLFKIELGK